MKRALVIGSSVGIAAVTTIELVLPSMRSADRGHLVVLSSQGDVLVSSIAPA